jgi:hypothetical protein
VERRLKKDKKGLTKGGLGSTIYMSRDIYIDREVIAMDAIAEVKAAQAHLEQEIRKTFEELVKKLRNAEDSEETGTKAYETLYPLSADPAIFKGETPTCVLFGEKRAIAHTWKNVFKLLILECNADVGKHKALMELRNKILGRARVLLSDDPRGMRRPFQIDKKLYAETHYDTETLMHILLHRILDELGFDYSNISVGV